MRVAEEAESADVQASPVELSRIWMKATSAEMTTDP